MKYKEILRKSFAKYMVIIFIFVIVLTGMYFAVDFSMIVHENKKYNDDIRKTLEDSTVYYSEKINDIRTDEELLNYLRDDGNLYEVNRKLYAISNHPRIRAHYVFMDADGKVISSNFKNINVETIEKTPDIKKFISEISDDPSKEYLDIADIPISKEEEIVYTVGGAIEDEGEIKAYIMFSLRERDFLRHITSNNIKVVLSDIYMNEIFSDLNTAPDLKDKFPKKKILLKRNSEKLETIQERSYFIDNSKFLNDKIILYTLTPMDQYKKRVYIVMVYFIVFTILFIVLFVFMTEKFSRDNARGIEELIACIDSEYSIEPDPALSLEFKKFYNTLKESNRKVQILLENRKNMEIKQIEEEFNPHFVFNVMESIRFQISIDPEKAEEMILSFANLMRYSINYGKTKVPLETDIAYLNDFLLLQKIRYNENLIYSFNIDDEILDCLVPKLILQPLIENCIKHAYIPGEKLKILISGTSDDYETIRFIVEDDGRGIDKEKLILLRESFKNNNEGDIIRHIGLYNIHKVLKLLYGDDYGLTIDSKEGKGTRITLNIPYEMEEL